MLVRKVIAGVVEQNTDAALVRRFHQRMQRGVAS